MQKQLEGMERERNTDCVKCCRGRKKRVWTSRLEIINSWKCRYVIWKHISVTSRWYRSLLSGCCSDITAPLGWGDAFYVFLCCRAKLLQGNSTRQSEKRDCYSYFFHPLVLCIYPVHRWNFILFVHYFIYWHWSLMLSFYIKVLFFCSFLFFTRNVSLDVSVQQTDREMEDGDKNVSVYIPVYSLILSFSAFKLASLSARPSNCVCVPLLAQRQHIETSKIRR